MVPSSAWTGLSGFGRAAQQGFGPASTDPNDYSTGLPTAADVPFDASSGLEDLQRGELAIKLYNAVEAFWLPVRFNIRVHPSPASDAAIDGRMLDSGLMSGPISVSVSQEGQVVALVDIPIDVPEGDYTFHLATIRRDANGDFETIQISFPVWGAPGSDQLTVLAADQGPGVPAPEFTPLEAIFSNTQVPESTTREQLRSLVPNPIVSVLFGNGTELVSPAATTIKFTYPDGLVEIADVIPLGVSGSGSIIRWQAEDIPGEPTGCDKEASLNVHVVDPDQYLVSIGLAFRLRDPFGACPEIAEAADFSISSIVGYEIDGTVNPDFVGAIIGIY